jgi:cobalt-zinc-cadmium resistance protein CzcA
MLQKIISFSINNKLVIFLFVAALIGFGISETTRLPIDAVPDITDNQVQIITVSPSLGAPDIERLITFPIEQNCGSISGLKQIRSFSRFGLSLITIVFNDNTDIYWARQQINERLQKVQQEIPAGIGIPEMAPVTTGLGEIYQYVLRPKKGYEQKFDAMQLRTLQDWIVRRQLLGTPGVADVSSFGGKLKQYEIAVNQEKLRSHGLSITDIFDALEKNNQNTGGAYIEKGPTVLYIRSEGLTTTFADIEQIVVKTLSGGTPLLVRDVATVQFGHATRYGAMTYNDNGEVAGAVVMMLKGENSSAVIKRVKARMAEIQKMLPEGVLIEPFLDRTKMVNNAIATVETNLIEGALIVIFVLVFFLGNLRAGLIVSSVIPLSMLFAVILMNLFGIGGNLMSLGAIDFGLIVDGSVIVVEAILHRFAHSRQFRTLGTISRQQMNDEVNTSTGKMITSAVFSQIIILIVYLPILSLQGIEGKMFKPMAFTIAFAIFGAFILSVTYVPMMASLVLSRKLNHKANITDRIIAWLERKYQPLLHKALMRPFLLIGITVVLFAASVVLLLNMGGEFIPELEEGDFAVETRLLTGSNLSNTVHATQQAAHILLRQFPEVQKVVTKIGSAEIPTDPMPLESGDMIIVLKDKKDWTSATTFDELSAKMTKALEAVPGISVGFQFPVQMRFNELMTGARQDVVCKIFGENLDTLTRYAHLLTELVKTLPGAINLYEERVTGMPQVVINYKREAMARFGLNVADINRVVNTAFAGQIAGAVYEGEKKFDMVVRLENQGRSSISDINNLMIPVQQGMQIPLSQVADISEVAGVNQVQRENTRRRIIVGFNIQGRDVQSIVNELKGKVNLQLKLPKEYTVIYGGSFENMTAAKERLAIVVPIALLLIFVLLYFAFSSVQLGLLIYSAIPLSATGGIFALWLRDMPFSISAGVGFIALFGVAVLNGILLVSEFNRLKKEGWTDLERIVTHATKSKLRAVVMTALVPSLGFIPMAISNGAGAEVQKPLATVVIGGLIISTMLTLFLLPTLYMMVERWQMKKAKGSISILVAILLLLPATGNTQPAYTLQQTLQMALANNGRLQAGAAEIRYRETLQHTTWDMDKTSLQAEYGSINSFATDNKLSLAQNIQFPAVYSRQNAVLRAETDITKADWEIQKNDISYLVKQAYYQLVLLKAKRSILLMADSIYANCLRRAGERLKAGETDILETAATTNQRMQAATQLSALTADYAATQARLAWLTGCGNNPEPADDQAIYAFSLPADTGLTPYDRLMATRLNLASREWKLEKARLYPSFNAGVSSMTIIGWQTTGINTEKYYGNNNRFNTVFAGVGLPLFFGAQQARIKAAAIKIKQQTAESDYQKLQRTATLNGLKLIYQQKKAAIANYQQLMLPNAEIIMRTAGQKLEHGEINYLEWSLLVNQAVQVKSEYYNTISAMNEAAFEIEKIMGIN